MPRTKSKIDEMLEQDRNDLIQRLFQTQGFLCFLCGDKINLQANRIEIDHIKPLADNGADKEFNLALMHAECNNKKRAKNLEVAKAIMKFEKIENKHNGKITTTHTLEEFKGGQIEVFAQLKDDKILIRFENKDYAYPIFIDQSNEIYKSFFALLPIKILHYDANLNPRTIGGNVEKLIDEFFRKNPQLHVALGRMHFDEKNGSMTKISLFDGQHKTTAQILLGRNNIHCRIFINPDKDHLKEVNSRVHKELRQIEFFRSVLDTLGQDIFSYKFREYLENPSTKPKSEKGFIDMIDTEKRSEMEKYLFHYLKARVRDFKEPVNKFLILLRKRKLGQEYYLFHTFQ